MTTAPTTYVRTARRPTRHIPRGDRYGSELTLCWRPWDLVADNSSAPICRQCIERQRAGQP